jgi:Flp pilus assembly protein TadD
LTDLGVAYTEEGKFADAERAFSDAITIIAKQPKQDVPALAAVYGNLSHLYLHEGKRRMARKMADKARALRSEEGSPAQLPLNGEQYGNSQAPAERRYARAGA